MKDIQTRDDIELLVDAFYKRMIVDDVIGFFFTEVMELDWDKHIPIMYDFWETILLGNIKYKGNPMLKHIALNKKEPLKPEHFDRWLKLWEAILAENFNGKNADEALNRAKQIGALMKFKVEQDAAPNS
ncbi:MAG: group III truncated hemoglobin [Cyclobacteriaceae bacterium]